VCTLIRVKLNEKWGEKKIWGPLFFFLENKMCSELSENLNFLAPHDDVDDGNDDNGDNGDGYNEDGDDATMTSTEILF
jgi:hypothetical protein